VTQFGELDWSPLKPHHVDERSMKGKEAAVGRLGIIDQCLGGDVVCVGSPKFCTWAEIGWVTDSAAMVHLWNRRTRRIDLGPQWLRSVPLGTPVRWVRVVCK